MAKLHEKSIIVCIFKRLEGRLVLIVLGTVFGWHKR